MTGVIPASWSNGAALKQRAGRSMDVILHLDAHRTGSTTFQSYMRRSNTQLSERGLGYWGPQRTRQGLFAGLMPAPHLNICHKPPTRAEGRVQIQLTRAARNGARKLMVSDENMIGSVRHNLRNRALYPAIGERMARYASAFDGQVCRIVLNIRAQDLYWSSAMAYGVARGHRMLPVEGFENLVASRRTWRNVITDLSCALPNTEICVLPFERYQGRPEMMLATCIDERAPINTDAEWLNRAPNVKALRQILAERGEISGLRVLGTDSGRSRWVPFNEEQCASLREAYADDMHWLISGADGLETLAQETLTQDIMTEDWDQTGTGNIPLFGSLSKGQEYDKQERYVAGHR
jgi:hypothetical protein